MGNEMTNNELLDEIKWQAGQIEHRAQAAEACRSVLRSAERELAISKSAHAAAHDKLKSRMEVDDV